MLNRVRISICLLYAIVWVGRLASQRQDRQPEALLQAAHGRRAYRPFRTSRFGHAVLSESGSHLRKERRAMRTNILRIAAVLALAAGLLGAAQLASGASTATI